MLEVVNSPLYDHGRQPQLELSEPRLEAMLRQTVLETPPDVCHVHELAGLPSSVLDVLHDLSVPTVMTLQDYFPLCPAFRLLDASGSICLRREVGADCLATMAAEPRPPGLLVDGTVALGLTKLPGTGYLSRGPGRRWISALARGTGDLEARRRARHRRVVSADAFQQRREANVERLSGVDVLVAMSRRVAEIYAQLGVSSERLRTIHLTLKHIEQLTPRRASQAPDMLTFATLAGFESSAKGADLLIGALRRLRPTAEGGRFRLLVLGHADPEILARAQGVPGFEIIGPYRPDELNSLLDSVDVGLMPSIWEEAYGYAGVEFLAKGIPVIANALGGMTDYVREGETGWLNRSSSPEELARIMACLIETPAEVARLNEHVISNRASIIKPHAVHVAEIDDVYREAMADSQVSAPG
jgi:glycosyltransferase involved in cell wall biosynthesis